MEQRPLGRSEIQVSPICLGTMTWGQQNDEGEAFAQMDKAVDYGVNFFDTAEMYPAPPTAETQGLTERYIGNWLRRRRCRDRIVLATKVTGRSNGFDYLRGGETRLDRGNIVAALEASLKRLRCDHVDLYQLHWPDRTTNFFGRRGYEHDPDDRPVPLEETLSVLGELVAAGKVRAIGVSNETPWGAMALLRLAESLGLPRPVSIQNPYNLVNRTFEGGLAEISMREDLGLLAYSPLAGGTLTGKYLGGAQPPGSRMTLFRGRYPRYFTHNAEAAISAYVSLAGRHGLDPAQMAIAYVVSRPFVTSAIIGATSLGQLTSDLESVTLGLSPEVLEEIEDVQRRFPNPCP